MIAAWSYFNPRAPCGARRTTVTMWETGDHISIHAPRVGRDRGNLKTANKSNISIHAPRVGRDVLAVVTLWADDRISIHAPRVGRDH